MVRVSTTASHSGSLEARFVVETEGKRGRGSGLYSHGIGAVNHPLNRAQSGELIHGQFPNGEEQGDVILRQQFFFFFLLFFLLNLLANIFCFRLQKNANLISKFMILYLQFNNIILRVVLII